ncbi:lysine--tRNA ligase [Lepeophtheirus salmonis]|uniref:lysine--tRNA ligase n=1 Tax=Lepeophtheirus salmonis TaxID=72036 RepID=UPI001AEA57EC|nr:probable lysine--tRNA ligase, cytoplasmic [Lepeophtheirus salmonis]
MATHKFTHFLQSTSQWLIPVRFRSSRKKLRRPKDPYVTTTADTYIGKPLQDWEAWDGYGPYKYRHHDYPNSGVLRDVNCRRIFAQRNQENFRLSAIAAATDIFPQELIKKASQDRAALPPSSNIIKLKRRCTVTGRERGIFHQYRLSRFIFRHQADYNLLSGIQRAIWNNLKDFRSQFDSQVQNNDVLSEKPLSLAGRIDEIRRMSKNLIFVSLQGGSKELSFLQLKLHSNSYISKEAFQSDVLSLKKGDIIGAEGSIVTRTKSGELSLIPQEIKLLSPCLRKIPSYKTGIDNTETRFRNRHLDLLTNGVEKRRIFETRAKVLSCIRSFLDSKDFIEVETPVLSTEYGGASAEPFVTHHEELETKMYMRISPELYLKRLIVGGFDRVFEIGKQFRNEGIDSNHNPEFTSIEFYAAYKDYFDIMDWTQELFRLLSNKLFQSQKLMYQDTELDLNANFNRLDFIQSLESATGKTFPNTFIDEESNVFLKDILLQHGLKSIYRDHNGKILDKLFSHFIEPELTQPTFVLDHPRIMCPLAKPHRSNPELSERFELYMGRQEIINAYTEMNDPGLQRKAFESQKSLQNASLINEEYCSVLDCGLPPTGGWGLGLDRLIMILTNQSSIKEVILFPTLKDKK